MERKIYIDGIQVDKVINAKGSIVFCKMIDGSEKTVFDYEYNATLGKSGSFFLSSNEKFINSNKESNHA